MIYNLTLVEKFTFYFKKVAHVLFKSDKKRQKCLICKVGQAGEAKELKRFFCVFFCFLTWCLCSVCF